MAAGKNAQQKPVGALAQSLSTYSVVVWHHSFNGAPLTPPTTPRQMTNTTMQVVINGNTVEGTPSQIALIIGNHSFGQKDAPVLLNQEEKSVKFVEFFGATLESYIKGGKLFVSELNRLRHNGNDYRALGSVYHDLVDAPTEGWAKRRKLLLTTSAIWRYTFKTKKGKYQIAADTSCDDCGEFAKAMVERMITEKLWVA